MSTLLEFLLTHEPQFRKARLASLYSDFRHQQKTNPDGYAANIVAWENGLSNAARAGLVAGGVDILSLQTGPELLQELESSDWGRPLALGAVIEEGVSHGRFVPLQSFIQSPKSIYDKSWTIRPGWLISWGLKQLGVTTALPDRLPTGRYVIIGNVKEAGSKVFSAIATRQGRVDRIIPMNAFEKVVADSLRLRNGISAEDLKTLLVHLSRDMNKIAYNDQLVKINEHGKRESRITSEDCNIASVKSLVSDLTKKVDEITEKIGQLSKQAKVAVENKNRASALRILRSKKAHEAMLARRSETLTQLEGVQNKIEEAADQVELVKVMQGSTRVLRSLNAEIGGAETVEDVLQNLTEEMEKVDDINTAIGENQSITIDEGAVDDELHALEEESRLQKEETEAVETQRRLDALKTFPSTEKQNAQPGKEKPEAENDVEAGMNRLIRLSLEETPIASS